MSPFGIYVGCGDCGGDVERVTGSPYVHDGPNREHSTVLKCKRCHHYWVLRSELLRAPADARATERQRISRRACHPREPLSTVSP